MKNFILALCVIATTPFFGEPKVLVLAGSTREESYNKKLAYEAAEIARGMGAEVTFIDLKNYPMPFYDADLEASSGMPENAKRLQALMIQSDAIVIASPEYNASFSALLKNSLDWASRSNGEATRSAFKGKKFALMSASSGGGGGIRGLIHLRAVIETLGGEVISNQVTVPSAYQVEMNNPALKKGLTQELKELF